MLVLERKGELKAVGVAAQGERRSYKTASVSVLAFAVLKLSDGVQQQHSLGGFSKLEAWENWVHVLSIG